MNPGLVKGWISTRIRFLEVTNSVSFNRDGSAQKQGSRLAGTARRKTLTGCKPRCYWEYFLWCLIKFMSDWIGWSRSGKHMRCSTPGQARGVHPFQRQQGHTMPNFQHPPWLSLPASSPNRENTYILAWKTCGTVEGFQDTPANLPAGMGSLCATHQKWKASL